MIKYLALLRDTLLLHTLMRTIIKSSRFRHLGLTYTLIRGGSDFLLLMYLPVPGAGYTTAEIRGCAPCVGRAAILLAEKMAGAQS
ncbi:hypothetical protein ORV05_04795 [Amycolatopsis cynarae]|uniref:Uncharacterized protein n=1 Tax=Amycolatopsis cynarae TaxID=2995223 RepID=A0ABY7B5A0_9PSEU|nr:hypothetical protein [Amycolatopsis sp. HUAS 11-8]WAL67109.1 hypothetical protein ORV05_04795 [Amycolatopsis sp. HUAS 11-8]